MLQTLLQPVVDMRLTLADTIAVMDLIDTSRQMAHEELPYAFGRLPAFLIQPEAWRMALPRVA